MDGKREKRNHEKAQPRQVRSAKSFDEEIELQTPLSHRRGINQQDRNAFSCLGAEGAEPGCGVGGKEGRDTDTPPTFFSLEKEKGGYFSGIAQAGAGSLYRFRVDQNEKSYPDPASRFQPAGPHGPSAVVDPATFRWSDRAWKGITLAGQIFYEMHIGTFTPEGTWAAAAEQLPELAKIGIRTIEMMPIADFAGPFGWGYDGVNLFAPTQLYGTPDDLRRFIDRAHSLGLGVILDVVYNHFGPEGNYLSIFSDDYMTKRHENDWGDAINFDGPNSGPVREFYITNGRYWIEEYHFDGFRFDATQTIIDDSDEYIIGAIGRAAREAAGKRSIVLVAENEQQETKLVRPRSEGGDDLDGVWNDDWHHSALVALTDRNEAYYTDYTARRRSSFQRRNTDISTKASLTTGRMRRAELHLWMSVRPPSWLSLKTTTKWRTRSQATVSVSKRRLENIAP